MTLEEKLARFSETLAKETQKQSEKAVSDYKKTLESNLNKHKEEAYFHADLQIKQAYNAYKKEKIKFLAGAKLGIKRSIKKRSNELKELLYGEVLKEITECKKTAKYLKLIEKYINKIKSYANGEDVIIYIDKSDEDLLKNIADMSGFKVEIASWHLIGGVCGYIPNGKILLNLSFADKLNDEIEKFDWNEEGWINE